MVEYKVVHIGQNPDTGVLFTHKVKNLGARFNPGSLELIGQAKPAIFIFLPISKAVVQVMGILKTERLGVFSG